MLSVASSVQETMLRVRLVEDRLQELALEGKGADWHFNRGQEAISVGVCAVLRDTDYIVCHHRTIAHAIAKGVPMRPLLAELLGKAEGLNGGLAGEMHMSYPPKRFLFSFQLVGTCVPVAAGIAWAVQNYLKPNDDIVVLFHGDAATANGQWHEGLNIAAVQKVPLLLVCENNHIAGNVRESAYLPVKRITDRALAYGLAWGYVDGNDIRAVTQAAAIAVNYVRTERRPYLLECDTTRLGRHKQGQGDLRSQEEKALLALRDPLLKATFPEGLREAMQAEIEAIVQEVLASPNPESEEAT